MKMTGIEKRFVNSAGRMRAVARDAQRLLEQIDPQPGWRYLDVGCGVGSGPRAIAERWELDVTAVDVDPDQIAQAQAASNPPNLRFLTMNATALQFGDAEFHLVASSMATHHIRDWERALSEMARVLQPGGFLLYVDLLFPGWLAEPGRLVFPFMGFPSARRLASFAQRAGLNNIHQTRSGMTRHTIYRKAVRTH